MANIGNVDDKIKSLVIESFFNLHNLSETDIEKIANKYKLTCDEVMEIVNTCDYSDSNAFDDICDSDDNKYSNEDNYDDSKEPLSDGMGRYLRSIAKYGTLSSDEEIKLFYLYKHDNDKKAFEKLYCCNLKLVVSIAKRYKNSGIELEDLIQSGNIGLSNAIERFDIDKGFKLSTYATWWIKQSISRYIADNSRTIRVPVYFHDLVYKLKQYEKKFFDVNGRYPSDEEIMDHLNITEDKLGQVKKAAQNTNLLSIDMPIGEDKDTTLGNFIPDDFSVSDVVDYSFLKDDVQQALKCLNKRERFVILNRFGFVDGREKTLEEVGNKLGVTRERVRQIESKALRKLRNKNNVRLLMSYTGIDEKEKVRTRKYR